jgi:hypothetical protein
VVSPDGSTRPAHKDDLSSLAIVSTLMVKEWNRVNLLDVEKIVMDVWESRTAEQTQQS